MINTSSESITVSGTLVDPEKDYHLKKTKTDIENNITKILKLIKNEDQQQQQQGKKNRNQKQVRKEAQLLGLIEDLSKQHQSLYALCDYLNSEYEKVVSRRRSKRGTGSTSESDSEYFSSEEIDNINRSPSLRHNRSNSINKIDEFFKIKELEEQSDSQKKEIESLIQQKKDLELQVEEISAKNRNLELQIESQAHEVEELCAKNTGLKDRVSEIELLLKQEKGSVSTLQAKLKNNEIEAKSNIAKLLARVKNLDMEAKSLRTQKDKMEEKIKGDRAEELTQRKDLMDRIDAMKQNLDSLCIRNKELENQVEKEREMVSQYLSQMQNLSENLAEMNAVKDQFLARIKDLEHELESESNKRNEQEEQLRNQSYDMKQLEDENKSLQDRNNELKRAITERGEEINALLNEPESQHNAASMQVMSFKAELNALRLELDNLQEQKSKLEIQNERSQKEYEEGIAKMENLNSKLTGQIADNEKTIERINAEHKETKILFNKFRMYRQTAERKMEELAEEFRKKMEDNIKILHQRIHVTEQLNNENKNNLKIATQRYKEENKMLQEKIASYEEELKVSRLGITEEQNGIVLSALNDLELATAKGLDSVVGKFEERKKHVLSRVYKMMGEVQFAKDVVKKRNAEMKELRELLNGKEEQELMLREKVWKLEAKVSKEGGEKLNLMNAVGQLEKRVGKLEMIVKEKDEDLVSLAEKKREAIRQLCFVVDFHRDRCKDLKNLLMKTNITVR